MWSQLSVSERQETFDAFLTMYWSAAAFFISMSAVLLFLLWNRAGDLLTDHFEGEPMLALAGVSLWPVLALRLLALLLSFWLVLLAFVQLKRNFDELCVEFGLIGAAWSPDEIITYYIWHEKRYNWWPSWLNPTYFYRIPPKINHLNGTVYEKTHGFKADKNENCFKIDKNEWKRIVLNSWTPHRIARVSSLWPRARSDWRRRPDLYELNEQPRAAVDGTSLARTRDRHPSRRRLRLHTPRRADRWSGGGRFRSALGAQGLARLMSIET
jgi:hypothetical protein